MSAMFEKGSFWGEKMSKKTFAKFLRYTDFAEEFILQESAEPFFLFFSFQHVHFPLMSMDEVEQSSRSHLVKKNKNLATALEEARTYLAKVKFFCHSILYSLLF